MPDQPAKAPAKIGVVCPHCGFEQLESPLARSTFCRKCSGHYEIENCKAVGAQRVTEPSLIDKVRGVLNRNRTRKIACFDCGATQEVSASATSSICPACSAYIDLQDFKITGSYSRNIRTRGEICVSAKGDLTSSKAICESAHLEGKVRGNFVCDGEATVKMSGRFLGRLEAHTLIVDKKADVEFAQPVKTDSLIVRGKISARIICDGTVSIEKRGVLEGSVFARAISVERGGEFRGDLNIGKTETFQPDLLPREEKPASRTPTTPATPAQRALRTT